MTRSSTGYLSAGDVRRTMESGDDVALIDVREAGQHGEGHPFLAVNAPYSRIEASLSQLVPRRAARVILLDAGDELAELAARRLAAVGYHDLAILSGGAQAWQHAGYTLFNGIHLPSKTFGEQIKHELRTPSIGALELKRWQDHGTRHVLLDGRTLAEHRTMTIPGSLPVPNGELALRAPSLIPDEHMPVVVHCAGRTRSIVGAQLLRELGLPNPVFALENGTQGWALAGLDLEHGSTREYPPRPPNRQLAPLRELVERFARRAAAPRPVHVKVVAACSTRRGPRYPSRPAPR